MKDEKDGDSRLEKIERHIAQRTATQLSFAVSRQAAALGCVFKAWRNRLHPAPKTARRMKPKKEPFLGAKPWTPMHTSAWIRLGHAVSQAPLKGPEVRNQHVGPGKD